MSDKSGRESVNCVKWRVSASDVREDYAERAAIREYDGGMRRADAERGARADLERRYPPTDIARALAGVEV